MATLALLNFMRKKEGADAASKQASSDRFSARPLQFVQSANASRTLVLGLNWRAILISGGAQAALQKARSAGATHYCMLGTQTLAYGKVPLGKGAPDIPEQAYPAALLASRLTSGDALFALTLSPTEVWVAVIRNGRPYGMDEVLADPGGSLTVIARDWLVEKLGQYTQAAVYSDIDLGAFDFKIQNCSLANLMTATTMAGDRLLKLPPISWLSKIEIPKPVLKVLVFLVFLWVANKAYDLWSAQVADELRAMQKSQELQVDDPAIRWPQALAEFARSRVHPGLDGLRVVRKSLGQLPLHWKGWKLGSANCKAQPPAGGQQVWDCSASYTPEGKSGAGTNADLKASMPEGFDIKFESMQQVSLEWKPAYKVDPLDLNKLPTRNQHLLETASQLQALLPAMSSMPSLSFTSSGVSPPKSNAGTDITRPANIVLPSEAPLSISGPLRTIDTLIDRGIAAEWRALSLTYAAMSGPVNTLLGSALQVQISGVLYAKD